MQPGCPPDSTQASGRASSCLSRACADREIRLLGTKPDHEVGREIGRSEQATWAKRRTIGIAAPPAAVRSWAGTEDDVVRSQSVSDTAKILNRTEAAIRNRCRRFVSTHVTLVHFPRDLRRGQRQATCGIESENG